MAPSEA